MQSVPGPALFSWLGLLLWLVWNFAVLSSIQLTVRLIRAYSLAATAVGALVLTLGSLPIAVAYWLSGMDVYLLPVAMLATAGVGYGVACWVLRVRRLRGRLAAALGTALLSCPWPLFLDAVLRLPA